MGLYRHNGAFDVISPEPLSPTPSNPPMSGSRITNIELSSSPPDNCGHAMGRNSNHIDRANSIDDDDDVAADGAPFPASTVSSSTTSSQQHHHHHHYYGTTDEDFLNLIATELQKKYPIISRDYPTIVEKIPSIITKWRRRFRGNVAVWKRIFHIDHIIKEFIEAVPVIDTVYRLIDHSTRISNDDINSDDENTKLKKKKQQKQFTIIDLASGKGYLSMILSELLPLEKVFRIVLMDKAWPMRNLQPTSNNINWEHIYGKTNVGNMGSEKDDETDDDVVVPITVDVTEEDDELSTANETSWTAQGSREETPAKTYYDTWPIALDTSKQDLKHSRQLKKIQEHYLSNPDHPVIILAIHLCGTLSMKAVQLFNDNPKTVHFLALKPCCLPGMVHAKRHEIFHLGDHSFPAHEVCIHGKWKKNTWTGGPPRNHIEQRFQCWSNHLYCGILNEDNVDDDDDGVVVSGDDDKTKQTPDGNLLLSPSSSTHAPPSLSLKQQQQQQHNRPIRKIHTRVMVQQGGGFQNDFLFAERDPHTTEIWTELERRKVVTDNVIDPSICVDIVPTEG